MSANDTALTDTALRDKQIAAYYRRHTVTVAPCKICGATIPVTARVVMKRWMDGNVERRMAGLTDYCVGCRKTGRAGNATTPSPTGKRWGHFDFTQWAEQTLYPGVPYSAMTMEQRRHTYWLARLRWASEGGHLRLAGVTPAMHDELHAQERNRLRTLRDTLRRQGRDVASEYTSYLDANADHHPHD